MKIFRNKLIKCSLIGVCCVVIAFLIELFGFNFKLLTLEKDVKEISSVEFYESIVDNQKVIKIDLDNIYVNKLKINYKADKDVSTIIKYVEKDYYDGTTENVIYDIFDNEVGQQITNFGNEIKEINIIYDLESNIDIDKISIDNHVKLNYFRIIFLYFVMIAIGFIYKFYKNGGSNLNIHKYFILLGLILGSTMIILQPSATYFSWDDQIHFSSVYELVGGTLDWSVSETSMVEGRPIGRDSIGSLEEQEQQKLYLNNGDSIKYSTYAGRFLSYDKVAYIPSALGYHIGKFLNFPFSICFKIGKFLNLLVYLLIIGYAIKITKIGKRLLVVLGLIPTSLFLACQYSYDPAVISGNILAVVCLVNWFVDKNTKVNFKNLLIFILAILYGCFSKAVYIPLILLFLFVPKDRFQTKKQAILVKGGIIVIFLLMMLTFVLPVVSGNMVDGDVRGGDTSVSGQIQVILENPVGYVKVLNDTMIKEMANSFIGIGALGNYAYMGVVSSNLYMIFLGVLLFVAFVDNSKFELNKTYKFLFLFVILGVILLIWTALYLSFTPVGLNTINGVQPRYFLPLLFPLLLCFNFNKVKFNGSEKKYNLFVLFVTVIINFISIYQLVLVHYCL